MNNVMELQKFKFLGRQFAFTHIGDSIKTYGIGCDRVVTSFEWESDDYICVGFNKGTWEYKNKGEEYWHKMCFGIYRRSNYWLRQINFLWWLNEKI